MIFAFVEFVAGVQASFLVGFTNKGQKDFIIDTLDASFRYPMDFTYYIQNVSGAVFLGIPYILDGKIMLINVDTILYSSQFTINYYNRVVKPQQQVTLDYTFIPAEALAHRPFGLSVNLFYKDVVSCFFYFDTRNGEKYSRWPIYH